MTYRKLITKAPVGHAGRGSDLERMVAASLRAYSRRDFGCGGKIRTPMIVGANGRPVRVGSTVDFEGGIAGIHFRLEAKETRGSSLPARNVKPHQMAWLDEASRCGGIGVLLVEFVGRACFAVDTLWWRDALSRDEQGARLPAPARSVPLSRFMAGGAHCFQVSVGAAQVPLDIASAVIALYRARPHCSPPMFMGLRMLQPATVSRKAGR